MATINDQITRIENAKETLRNSIIGKGVGVPAGTPLKEFPAKISAIKTGGGKIDLAGTGWEKKPFFPISTSRLDTIGEDISYTKTKFAEWNPSATNTNRLYSGDKNLVYAPYITTSKVTNMGLMFMDCTNLATVPELDATNVSNAQMMFKNCPNLTNIGGLKGIGQPDIKLNLSESGSSKITHESLMNVINGLAEISPYTPDDAKPKLILGQANLAKLTEREKAIVASKSWVLS